MAWREPVLHDLTVTRLEPLWGKNGPIFYRPWLFEEWCQDSGRFKTCGAPGVTQECVWVGAKRRLAVTLLCHGHSRASAPKVRRRPLRWIQGERINLLLDQLHGLWTGPAAVPKICGTLLHERLCKRRAQFSRVP